MSGIIKDNIYYNSNKEKTNGDVLLNDL